MGLKLPTGSAAWEERARQLLGRLPVAALASEKFDRMEQGFLQSLKQKLDALDEGSSRRRGNNGSASTSGSATTADAHATPAELLQTLLSQSLEHEREQSRDEYYLRILRQIVPDEARILAALSDGASYALLHVAHGSRLIGTSHLVLENLSNVGRAAGVQCIDLVPAYVTRLRSLGLAETGAEDESLRAKYEMLETEEAVRKATEHGKGSAVRRTLRISAFGKKLWDDCHNDGDN